MAVLTRDAILASDDLPRELVSVPEWGGDVYVRGMTGVERDAYESAAAAMVDGDVVVIDDKGARARLVGFCIVDEAGQRLFSDDDIVALAGKSAAPLDRVYHVAARLSGIGRVGASDAVGNSEAGQTGDSSSD